MVFDTMPRMLTRGQKAFLIFSAVLFAFVLTCPATDTPTAVYKAPVIFMVIPVVLFTFRLPELEFLHFLPACLRDEREQEDILALTCTRLC